MRSFLPLPCMSKQLKSDTEAVDAYFASFEPIDVRPQTPTRLPMASSRISSRARSTRRLCLEQLEAREVPSATVFGDASNNWDSALVSTPPSDSYETVDVRLVPHSSGIVVDNANVNFGEGVLIKVSTGTGAGTVLKDDALTSLDDAYNTLHGTAANPLGTDHMNFNFVSRLTGAIAIRLKQLDLGHIAHGNVLIDGSNGRTTVPIPSNGVIPWNPTVGIDSIMLVNVHNQGELNPVGLSGIDVQMYLPDTPVDIGTLTTQVAALTQQVSDAQTALTLAQATATPPPAVNALPWPEGVNASAKILGKLNVHAGQNLYAMHFSPDGNKFVTAGQDKVAKIWNASTGALLHTLSGNNSLVMDAVWSADGQSVWTTGYDKHVRQYSASTGAVLWDSGDLGSLALSAAMSSDGANLTVSMHGTAPKVINTQTKAVNALGNGLIWTGNMTAMSDANVLMYVNTNAYRSGNYALIVNPATRQTVWQSNVMGGQLNAIAATPDGQWVIAGDDAGGLAVWKRSTNQQVFTLPNQGGVITSIATSEDGNQLFVGSGSQITAFDLRPLTTNQAPTLLHTYASIGNGPRGMSVQGKNVTAVSGDNGASRLVAVDRSGLSGYVDPNLGVNTAQTQLTALQNSLASSTSQLQLAQNQETGRDAIMEILAQQLVEPQSVEADTLEVTVQGNRVDAEMTLRTVGGNVRISSWQGVRSSLPSLDRDDDGSLLFTGSAATLDLAQATHLVTSVSFVVTTSTGHDATVRFLRGDQVIATQTVHSGATVSQADAQGITGVVVLNEEQSLSEQAQDFLAYFNSNDGQYQAGRYAWSWWTQNGYKSFPQFGGASLAYFANHSSVPDAQKWDILREAASGRHYATLQLADIDVQGNVNQAQAAAPHPLEQTPTGLLLNAPDWRQTGDTLRRGASPGYLATGRFSPTAVGIVRDPTKYSVVNLTNVSGDAHLVSVRYHTPGGDTQLGQEYYQILGNSVVLMPGAPSQIVITLHSGDIYQDPGNVDIGHIQSNTLEDILPPETMSVWTSILAIRNTGPAEGVMNAVTEITDTGRAITPCSGNALVNVWNSGRTGGTVRIITNEGTPQAHEISFSLAAQAGKAVSINFTTPANGVLSITTILPDGRRVVDGKTLRLQGDTSEKRVATRNADGTWTLEWKASTYSGPSVVDGGVMDNNFVLWKQQRIANGDLTVADPANYAKAVMAFAEETIAVKQIAESQSSEEYENAHLGGSNEENYAPNLAALIARASISGPLPEEARVAATIVSGRLKRELYDQALQWLPQENIQSGSFQMEGQTLLRTSTVAGKILSGVIYSLKTHTDASSRWTMAFMAQALTNIPAQRFLNLVPSGQTISGLANAVATLVSEAGYVHLLTSSTLPTNDIIMAVPDRDSVHPYTNPSQPVRIRFDLPLGMQSVRSIGIYNDETLLRQSAAGTFIEIQPSDFPEIFTATTFHLQLRVKSDGFSAQKVIDLPAIVIDFPPPHAVSSVQDFSVSAPGPEKNRQDFVLSQLARNFPVSNGAEWTWDIGSDYHVGKDRGFYAADLNRIGGENGAFALGVGDANEKGTIVKLDNTYGAVTIRYSSLTPAGETVSWYVQYLHLKIHETSRFDEVGNTIYEALNADGTLFHEWAVGNTIVGREPVGLIAGRGPKYDANGSLLGIYDDAFSPHVHVASGMYDAVNVAHAIDLRRMLTATVHHVTASDAGPDGRMGSFGDNASFTVTWNPTFQTWQPANAAAGVLYNRNAQENATSNALAYWVAWDPNKTLEQMERVVYTRYQYRDASGTLIADEGWISVNPISDIRKIWTGSSWSTNTLATIFDSSSQTYVPLS